MPEQNPSSGLETLAGAARKAGSKGPPPVHLWNPPFCGDLDMRIAADGTWFYLKTPIGRHALVKLFASVLWREGDNYFLVTPVEKVGITVDDAPFTAVEMKQDGEGAARTLSFRTNVDDWVTAGKDHALRFEPEHGNRGPQALPARSARSVGAGDARAVLRSGRARRGARRWRHAHVRRCLGRGILRHGAGREGEKIRLVGRWRRLPG